MEADQSKIEHGYDTYKLFMIFFNTQIWVVWNILNRLKIYPEDLLKQSV